MTNRLLFGVLICLVIIDPATSFIPSERIFGGITAENDTFPWMVSVRILNPSNLATIVPVCAGSILSETFVLTAASCIFGLQSSPLLFSVRAGIHQFFKPNNITEQIRQVTQILVHPSYNATRYVNDIAMLRLLTPFNFRSPSVSSISLSNVSRLEDLDLIATGWGVLNQSNPTIAADFLQQVVVQEDVNCTMDVATDASIQLCASGTCVGDSGGPLMIESNVSSNYELVAVTSHRTNCTDQGLFTRIEPYLNWIRSILATIVTIPTLGTTRTSTRMTTTTNTLGPPITFVCNTSYTCGCSPIPVVFHDDPARYSRHPRIQARIVGGEEAQPLSWSWQVSIHVPPLGHTCGGSMINDRWVLTAAHCLLIPNITFARVSVHDKWSTSGQDRLAVDVIKHPNFIPGPKFINDIALLRLASPIVLSQSGPLATRTCLPPQTDDLNYPLPGTRLAVIGWGRLIENGAVPDRLQQVRVVTLRNNDWRCSAATFDQQRQFCAMVDGGGKDSCQGDSGGPIHQWLNDHWEQVGIVSYGTGCAEPNNTGVYTRLAFYHDWIHNTIRQVEGNIMTTLRPMTNNTVFFGNTTIATLTNSSSAVTQTISHSDKSTVATCTTITSSIHSTVSTRSSSGSVSDLNMATSNKLSSAMSTDITNQQEKTTQPTTNTDATESMNSTSRGAFVHQHQMLQSFHLFFIALTCIAFRLFL